MPQPHVGGSFAPPLTDELLEGYRGRVDALPASAVKDALLTLLPCCEAWWGLPEPSGTAEWDHPSGVGRVVSLQPDHAQTLDGHIPWAHELEAIQTLLDTIDPEKDCDLRNLAFHLLWHVKELDLGREPLTADRLQRPENRPPEAAPAPRTRKK